MRGDAGKGEKIVEREVPVANGIEAVGGDAGEAEVARQGMAVDGKGTTG